MTGIAVWITGLPGSGKSALADALLTAHPGAVLLRMDDMRRIVTPEPTYAEAERDLIYRSLVYCADRITRLGHDVVIDATAHRRIWRELARGLMPRFLEIYIRCPLEVCMQRERERKDRRGAPPEIYTKGTEGEPVPGVSIPYEEPLQPDLVIDCARPVEDSAGAISSMIRRMRSGYEKNRD